MGSFRGRGGESRSGNWEGGWELGPHLSSQERKKTKTLSCLRSYLSLSPSLGEFPITCFPSNLGTCPSS